MVRAKNPSSSLEIFGLFFSSSFSFIHLTKKSMEVVRRMKF